MSSSPVKGKGRGKLHYAWIILVGCILYQGATTGIIYNTLGLFYAAICEDLGFRTGDLSMYSTLRTIATSFAMPFTLKLMKRYPMKYVVTIELAIVGVLFGLMGLFHDLIWWYITGTLMGIVGSSLFAVPVTLVINNWFKEKNGLAIGIALASSGLFGAVLNPIVSELILAFGWRIAVAIMAAVMLIIAMPMTMFVMRMTPQEIGKTAYGEGNHIPGDVKKNVSMGKVSYKNPKLVFGLCILCGATAMWTCQYYSHMARYAQSVGYDLEVAALVTSCAMIGNIFGKLLMGALSDKWGIWKTSRLMMAIVCVSFIMLLAGGQNINVYVMYVASALQGVSMAVATILANLMSLDVYKADYQEKYGTITAVGTFVGAVAFAIIGYSFDFTGSYSLSFLISVIACVFFFVGSFTLKGIVNKEQAAQNVEAA